MSKIKTAINRYSDYHWGKAPDKIELIDKRILIPDTLVVLGVLRGLLYQTTKRGDPSNTIYIHAHKKPYPYLCSDVEMKNLYIIGGSYKIEDRGIVD